MVPQPSPVESMLAVKKPAQKDIPPMTLLDDRIRSDRDRAAHIARLVLMASHAAAATHTHVTRTRQCSTANSAVDAAAKAGHAARTANVYAQAAAELAREAGQAATTPLMKRAAITLLRQAHHSGSSARAAERAAADAATFAANWYTGSTFGAEHHENRRTLSAAAPEVDAARLEASSSGTTRTTPDNQERPLRRSWRAVHTRIASIVTKSARAFTRN
ncbi:hypothetical protein [Rhodococcus pyridinivorans]|uniref:hypothetical protein n=1 Tax=Rhodococcus pyridinivorans TaxID=103816 RepID=UPI003AAEB8BF